MIDITQATQSTVLPELRTTATDPDAPQAAKARATALLALYAASVESCLKGGGTKAQAEYSGAFDLWLYGTDTVEEIERAEKDTLRERS